MLIGALACAVMGAVMDVRCGRIPNWLTRGALLGALALQAIFSGWRGLELGFAGALVAGSVFFLVYLVRGMGAGDVKLMAAVGAWVGLGNAAVAIMATAIAGGVLALVYIALCGQAARVFRNVAELIRFHAIFGITRHPEISLHDPKSIRLPYGLAIAAGTLYVAVSTGTLWRG
ncbi:MAG: A24 family peptidase [Terriglobia bacterium]